MKDRLLLVYEPADVLLGILEVDRSIRGGSYPNKFITISPAPDLTTYGVNKTQLDNFLNGITMTAKTARMPFVNASYARYFEKDFKFI